MLVTLQRRRKILNASLYCYLYFYCNKIIIYRLFKNKLGLIDRSFAESIQEDVFEFFTKFLCYLREKLLIIEDIPATTWHQYCENNFLDSEFGALTSVIYTCQRCRIETEREDHTHILQVHLENPVNSLKALIEQRLQNEEVVEKICNRCSNTENIDHLQKTGLKKLPKMLIIALTRFNNALGKNTSPVLFTNTMILNFPSSK